MKKVNVILSSIEIDSLLFQSRTAQYIQIGELFHKNKSVIYFKYIEAFIGILSYRLNIEILKFQQSVIGEQTERFQIDSSILLKTLTVLGMLIIFLMEKMEYEKFFQYYKAAFHHLKLYPKKKPTNIFIHY